MPEFATLWKNALGDDLWTLISRAGSALRRAEEITTLRSAGLSRAAFRLVLADGRVLKGRRVLDDVWADRIVVLAARLDPSRFPPVLDRLGCALLTAWVDGEAIDPSTSSAGLYHELGTLQGCVHASSLDHVSGRHLRIEQPASSEALIGEMEQLVRLGGLTAAEAEGALDRAGQAPDSSAEGLCHGDLAPENVVRTDGRLTVIDNENLAVGDLDLDLGRACVRWRMDAERIAAFLEGYREFRDPARFLAHRGFFETLTRIRSASFRLAACPELARRPLDQLRGKERPSPRGPCGAVEVAGSSPDPARVFALRESTVEVTSTEPGDLGWLHEFFSPQFGEARADAAGRRVSLVVSGPRFEALYARGPEESAARIACFQLERRTVRHARWSDGAARTVFDSEFGVFYRVEAARGDVEILAPVGRQWQRRLALMRVVREIVTSASIRRGDLLIHGAACHLEGRGIVIAGPRESGKTTLLVQLLSGGQSRYVSNDRVLLCGDSIEPRVVGVPTIVSLRRPTLDLFPRMEHRLRTRCYQPALTLSEAERHGVPVEPDVGGKRHVSPSQFCELTNSIASSGCELDALVFPTAAGAGRSEGLVRLDREDSLSVLRESLFREPPRDQPSLFDPLAEPRENGERDRLVERLGGIPAYRLHRGYQTEGVAPWPERLRETLARELPVEAAIP